MPPATVNNNAAFGEWSSKLAKKYIKALDWKE
jgi:hypothetical protein